MSNTLISPICIWIKDTKEVTTIMTVGKDMRPANNEQPKEQKEREVSKAMLGTKLKEVLKREGTSIKELAVLSGISENTFYSITKRDSDNVKPNIIMAICHTLNIDPEEFYPVDSEKYIEVRRIMCKWFNAYGFINWVMNSNIYNTLSATEKNIISYMQQRGSKVISAYETIIRVSVFWNNHTEECQHIIKLMNQYGKEWEQEHIKEFEEELGIKFKEVKTRKNQKKMSKLLDCLLTMPPQEGQESVINWIAEQRDLCKWIYDHARNNNLIVYNNATGIWQGANLMDSVPIPKENIKVAEAIKRIRIDNEMTQQDLAKSLGVSRQIIGAYETGERDPGLTNIFKIAKALEVDITELITEK